MSMAPVKDHNPADAPILPQRPPAQSRRERYGYSSGPNEGASVENVKNERRDEEARANQTNQYEVKPRASLPIADGRILRGGDPVTIADLAGDREWLSAAIQDGVVSEISEQELAARVPSPKRNRYRVGKKALIGKDRILEPGEWVCGDDFPSQAASAAVQELPAKYDALGLMKEPPQYSSPARPAITGQEVLDELLRRGRVIDTAAMLSATPQKAHENA